MIYPKTLTYVVPAGGPVEVNALARSIFGSGQQYSMRAYVKNRTAFDLSASATTASYGGASTLAARLTTKDGTVGVAGESVTFYSSADGKNWTQ